MMMGKRRPAQRAFDGVAYKYKSALTMMLMCVLMCREAVQVCTSLRRPLGGGTDSALTDGDPSPAAAEAAAARRSLLSGRRASSSTTMAKATAVLCHPTLLNATVDPVRVLHWANYHHSLGFRRVFLWWSVPDNDSREARPSSWMASMSPEARRAWETLLALPHVHVTVVPEAAALGTDRFEVRCLRESARSDHWAALMTADQYLWLAHDNSTFSDGASLTLLVRFLDRYDQGTTRHHPSTLELTRRTYSSLFRDETNSSLFGGIHQFSYEQLVECGDPAWRCSVATSSATIRRVGGLVNSHDPNSSIESKLLDPSVAHVKEWPGFSITSAGDGHVIEAPVPPHDTAKIGRNQSIAYERDSNLHGWFEFVESSSRRRRSHARSSTLEDPPTIYFVVTASLQLAPDQEGLIDSEVRRRQYARGIESLLRATEPGFPLRHKVVVVENNGRRPTFLDDVDGISVLYTDNNRNVDYPWKGSKELLDVLACIEHFGMRDHDLVVKMTGRYYLDEGSHFFGLLRNIDWTSTKALIKFGPYLAPTNVPQNDCITGLIMMPVDAVRRIDLANPIVEHSWAKAARTVLPPSSVHAIQGAMGIQIAPGGAVDYVLV